MKKKMHAIAGGIGFLMILSFWSSTVVSELFGSHAMVLAVKSYVLKGMFVLIPAMALVGASGMSLGAKWKGKLVSAKKKRMPIIAANGLLILVPAAFFLHGKAVAGEFDAVFYGIQIVELIAGATNLTLMGLNIRDGLRMTRRIPPAKA